MTATIEVDGLTQRFGDRTALDGLALRLEGGRIHGLVGRNGSGKTTLLSAIAGFRRPTAGQVRIDDRPVFEDPVAMEAVCLIRGRGDSVDSDWPDDKVRHALAFAEATRPGWDGDYAARLLDRFGLDPRQRLEDLSTGKRSAVGVVLGLASRAPVTLFDESSVGMDAPSRYVFYDELLADFMAHRRTIVVSTHLVEEVSALFEQVTVLDRGRVLLSDGADELRERGVTVTGPAPDVDRLTAGRRVLASRTLGRTKQAALFGALDPAARERATAAGLELGPIALQDLFVHLTATEEERR